MNALYSTQYCIFLKLLQTYIVVFYSDEISNDDLQMIKPAHVLHKNMFFH